MTLGQDNDRVCQYLKPSVDDHDLVERIDDPFINLS